MSKDFPLNDQLSRDVNSLNDQFFYDEWKNICSGAGLSPSNEKEDKIFFYRYYIIFHRLRSSSLEPDILREQLHTCIEFASKIFKKPRDCILWSLHYISNIRSVDYLESEIYAFSNILQFNTAKACTFAEYYWQANQSLDPIYVETRAKTKNSPKDGETREAKKHSPDSEYGETQAETNIGLVGEFNLERIRKCDLTPI